jgi:gamma-glutamyl-gamma-aminobutyrate hydrolase PuuD
MKKILNKKFYNALDEELRLKWRFNYLQYKTEEGLTKYLSEYSRGFSSFIDKSFTWSDTSEGHLFWSNISTDLNSYMNSQVVDDTEIIKVYVVGEDKEYFYWLKNSEKYMYSYEEDIYKSDLVIFTGGEDVHFSLYSDENNQEFPSSHYNIGRDLEEMVEYNIATELGLKKLGICRGAQFLCVQAGGTLVQDMHHPSHHTILDRAGKVIPVTSSHHQAAVPPSNSSILGFTDICESAWITAYDQKYNVNVENVWYPNTNSLGIQSHPEWQDPSENKYFVNLVDDFISDKGFFKDKNDLFTEEDVLKMLKKENV